MSGCQAPVAAHGVTVKRKTVVDKEVVA